MRLPNHDRRHAPSARQAPTGRNLRLHIHIGWDTYQRIRQLAFNLESSFANAVELLCVEALDARGVQRPARDVLDLATPNLKSKSRQRRPPREIKP